MYLIRQRDYFIFKVISQKPNFFIFIKTKNLYFNYFEILGFYPLLEKFVINSLF